MSFFEPPPPPPPARPPEWSAPPPDMIGGVVPLNVLAARSEEAAVWLASAIAYPTGVDFRLHIRWRPEVQGRITDVVARLGSEAGGELPPEQFRAGFALGDGSKATWLGPTRGRVGAVVVGARPGPLQPPEGPVLVAGSGAGGHLLWDQQLWLWPLPALGPLEFVCEWPAFGIELTRRPVDLEAIRNAARSASRLWPRD